MSLVRVVYCQVDVSELAEHLPGGVLLKVICLTECDIGSSTTRRPRPTRAVDP